MRIRRGQAVIELTLGLVAIAILVSAFVYVVRFMTSSLRIQNHLRSSAPVYAESIHLDRFAAQEVFGQKRLHVYEPHWDTSLEIK